MFDRMKVVVAPDPGLRTVCEPCVVGDPSLKKLAKRMAATMYKADGCGLAAPQVGLSKRLIVIDCDVDSEEQNPIALVNPELLELTGDPVEGDEGCLSCPGITVPVARQPWARVRYFDLDGNECEIEGDGLLGRCLQHEIDHLNGITLFEACTPQARLQALQDYAAAKAAGAKPGDTSIN
ncbi:MAG: peptide deformylase [Coriobacteriia bacterium]|nr:peptide deformylase [Coriobacteriia bacterium]